MIFCRRVSADLDALWELTAQTDCTERFDEVDSSSVERCPSGLRNTPGKRVDG